MCSAHIPPPLRWKREEEEGKDISGLLSQPRIVPPRLRREEGEKCMINHGWREGGNTCTHTHWRARGARAGETALPSLVDKHGCRCRLSLSSYDNITTVYIQCIAFSCSREGARGGFHREWLSCPKIKTGSAGSVCKSVSPMITF